MINKYVDMEKIHENPRSFLREGDGMVDWGLADGWNIQFDTLYEFFMKAGNIESKTRFGMKLCKLGLIKMNKKVEKKTKMAIIGIRPVRAGM